MTAGGNVGNIYDLGYQGYDGPRLGRRSVGWALLVQTVRAAYGIGRGGRAKIAPFGLAAFALLPAVIEDGVRALMTQAGAAAAAIQEASPIRHDSYLGLSATIVMLFCAAQAPELFGRDQRYGVLPLFFSRSLARADYALARLGGLLVAIFALTIAPHVVLTVGAAFAASDPITGLAADARAVPPSIGVSLLTAGVLGGISSVVAAWTPRRAYATATIIGIFVVPPIVVALSARLAAGGLARVLILGSPGDILDGANAALFGTIPDSPAVAASGLPGWAYVLAAAILVAACIGLVVRRYQRVAV